MSKAKKALCVLGFSAVFVLGLFVFSSPVRADATITGKIIKTDGTPIVNMFLHAYRDNLMFSSNSGTDADGNYTITIPSASASGVYAVKTRNSIYVYDMGTTRGHSEYYYIQENNNVSVT